MYRRGIDFSLRLAAFGAALTLCAPAVAHDPAHHAHHAPQSAQAPAAQGLRLQLSDTPLQDQDGRSLRLLSDAIGERIVVVDFVYTHCTTVCPVVSAVLAQLQERLGERAGRDVGLISITVDPVRDTSARLKDYGAQHGAGRGWTWLTGAKPQVDEVLRRFGAYTANFADHPSLVLVGDVKTGKWLRFAGFPSVEQLLGAVVELSVARAKAGSAG